MSKAGRPRKSDAVKKAQGTYRADRSIEHVDFGLVVEMPEPSGNMTPLQIEYFKLICGLLMEEGLLTKADVLPISRAAWWYAQFEEASEYMNKNGRAQVTPEKGWGQVRPEWGMVKDAEKNIREFENAYGIWLTGREKIKPRVNNDDDDDW